MDGGVASDSGGSARRGGSDSGGGAVGMALSGCGNGADRWDPLVSDF
jgi:hypothetical protein